MTKTQENKGFRLIAITPLKGCSRDFCKNLEPGTPYKFYDGYEIIMNDDGSSIKSAKRKEGFNEVEDLYQLKNGIKLSFSAVVGKNGSGKSALFELFYYLVYVIGIKKKIFKPYKDELSGYLKILNQDHDAFVKEVKSWKVNINSVDVSATNNHSIESFDPTLMAFQFMQLHDLPPSEKGKTNLQDLYAYVQKSLNNKIKGVEYEVDQEVKSQNRIEGNLKVSVLYEIDDNDIFEIKYTNSKLTFSKFNSQKANKRENLKALDLEKFFYSISLNYSHHSLNSRTLGNWIARLFHKNDAYRTPVVINPMRTNGNFDINKELRLSNERLMANLFYNLYHNNNYLILGKYSLQRFIFTIKKELAFPPVLIEDFEKLANTTFIRRILQNQLGSKYYLKLEYLDYFDFALKYLENKIDKIDKTYYFLIHKNINADYYQEILDFINKDKRSHVTKKIRHVINFIKMSIKLKDDKFWKISDSIITKEFTPEELINWVRLGADEDINDLSPSQIIEYALPSFFTIDFLLQDKNRNSIKFSELSSGEQQIVFNTNSILYHLYNLQSIHGQEDRVKYKNINIILDEIELYYHTDMQRRLVKELVDSFELLKKQDEMGIEAINVCLMTHSPFILSDIPSTNILRLKDGNPEPFDRSSETFGSNVHDLLANEFFMEDGFMGEFAKEKIKSVISSLQFVKLSNQLDTIKGIDLLTEEQNNRKLNLKKELDELDKVAKLDKSECEQIIRIIGEPVLYQSLMELYAEAYPESKDNYIDAQIHFLEQLKGKQ